MLVIAAGRRRQQETRVCRAGVTRAAPAVFLAATRGRAGNAQLTRGWIDSRPRARPLMLVRFGRRRRVVDGIQRAGAGRRRRGRERAPRLLAERLGRRVAAAVRRVGRADSGGGRHDCRRRAYAIRARVAHADLDPLVIATPNRLAPAARPVHVWRTVVAVHRRADGRRRRL